ncbi:hypothetical protein BDZ89DRAFT_980528 [Hymenopellis radicata]|nr:hypothetical protein BDZ89DRAFT_980528 [Hymenopellis radicata]
MPKSPPSQAEAGPSTTPQDSSASTHELFQYTITSYSTCWIRDIMTMEQHPKTKEFFMLGRVPCRNVEFVGLCVGVDDSRDKYANITVDDGTAVIECVQRKDPVPPPSPSKIQKTSTLVVPPPVAEIGWPLRITGKVFSFHETKRVQINTIERVQYNDEPRHWKRVRNLHDTDYDLKEPFVLPAPKKARPATPETTTPEGDHSAPPSSTPPPSPSPPPPPIIPLRDPARLHTADLTPNTFRMYVQHYMKHAAAEGSERLGFTLSHLRRVPVLAVLAKRVVKAAHRALRKKTRGTESSKLDAKQLSTKMKRLFVGAIRELNFEGNILLWDGPVHSLAALASSGLWKTQTQTQQSVDVTAMTTILGEEDAEEVSDPEEQEEEAYVPTDAYLRDVLREQIKRRSCWRDRKVVMTADIVGRLRRDAQWEFVGDWHVDEALKGIGTVYKVRGGWRCCE